MGTDFQVGTRPADGVCPDCGRVIRDGVWFRHRQVAHGATLALAPVAGSVQSAEGSVVALRPGDGVCPDCGRRIAPELWENHREHVHGTPRSSPGTAGGTPRTTATAPPRPSASSPRTDAGHGDAKRAGLAWTLAFVATAIVAFVVYVGDVSSWAAKSEACQALTGRGHQRAPATPQSCGFFALAASFQTIALVVGIVAVLLAFVAPLIPVAGGSARE